MRLAIFVWPLGVSGLDTALRQWLRPGRKLYHPFHLPYLGGHIRCSLSLANGPHQAGDVNDAALALPKEGKGQLWGEERRQSALGSCCQSVHRMSQL